MAVEGGESALHASLSPRVTVLLYVHSSPQLPFWSGLMVLYPQDATADAFMSSFGMIDAHSTILIGPCRAGFPRTRAIPPESLHNFIPFLSMALLHAYLHFPALRLNSSSGTLPNAGQKGVMSAFYAWCSHSRPRRYIHSQDQKSFVVCVRGSSPSKMNCRGAHHHARVAAVSVSFSAVLFVWRRRV